jgi:hypothetical protein
MRLRAARFLTDFDSSVNMVRALGRFLRGRDHRGLSVGPASPTLPDALAALPAPGSVGSTVDIAPGRGAVLAALQHDNGPSGAAGLPGRR